MSLRSVVYQVLSSSINDSEDFNKAYKKLTAEVREALSLLQSTQKQLSAVTAQLMLEVESENSDHHSPSIEIQQKTPTIDAMDRLRKNYVVIKDLYSALTSLNALEVRLLTNTRKSNLDDHKARSDIDALRREINRGLSNTFAFLTNLADNNMPEKLDKFVDPLKRILESSITYSSGSATSYVFEVDGSICFSTYICLENLVDEGGQKFPKMYVVATLKTGRSSSIYLALLSQFQPPSDNLLVKKVKTVKECTKALNEMFELDNFANSIGSLPTNVMLRPDTIERELISYGDYISNIQADVHEITFYLKPSASKDKSLADRIATQIFKDFHNLKKSKSDARIRMSIRRVGDSYHIRFFFVASSEESMVQPSDLHFLAETFNIDMHTVNRIAKVINTGVE